MGDELEEEMDEPYFCWRVAQTNKLELLKWARERKSGGDERRFMWPHIMVIWKW